ncbi:MULTISPECIES: immunity 21 family protein [unclassified Streptomyces]|uniref:immunity 21 family protein n=1 Tax=unclassified Streptomyces TaxID=2593676 RepID=UPI00225867D8|nr:MULTISPECIES: immunity 21 family protein [unclassified Streptomyces]MCX4976307.1 immunity 21 family protein [Streptomyces sp. NBC_00620]WRZ24184.1 immunity 21 family protein [Streptomyces sp. NBC_00243]
MARYAEPGAVEWVESGGGPLIVIPEVVLPFWSGADGDETSSDYDRACDVDGYIGLVPVGDTRALVLGDEPASTAFLPEHGTFVRWCAADSEDELLAIVPAALEAAVWEPEVHWNVPGPVVLFDAAWPGSESKRTDHLKLALEPGRYAVRATYAEPGPETWVGLVQLRRLPN